ncbi:putative exonuclease [Serratia phage vB_SmaS_Opt-169]|nr:putative exonuclease [Serratia phage vB_SmaS_Opt-169]
MDFCFKHSVTAIDNECSRAAFLSSRFAIPFHPDEKIKRVYDERVSFASRLISDLRSMGVSFMKDTPQLITLGYGHIFEEIDAVISGGLPECNNERALMSVSIANKIQFKNYKSNGLSSFTINAAQLCMAVSEFKKFVKFIYCPSTGDIDFTVIDIDFNLARKVYETVNKGVSSESMPIQLAQPETGINKKCESCPFGVVCMAPETPPPTCRTCIYYRIGPNGYSACNAQNGKQLSPDEQVNRHSCEYHRFNPDFLSTWATVEEKDFEKNRIKYLNLLNGNSFYNGGIEGDYSSYEINGCKGKELVGDSGINMIKKTFSAKVEG